MKIYRKTAVFATLLAVALAVCGRGMTATAENLLPLTGMTVSGTADSGFVLSGANVLKRDEPSEECQSCFEKSVSYEFRTIEHETVVTALLDEYENYYRIADEGADGTELITYAVASVGERVATKAEVSSRIVVEPRNREIYIGTKPLPELHEENETFILPNDGRITDGFGARVLNGVNEYHSGVDISAATGDTIVAGLSGRVVMAQYSGSYGNMVKLQHDNGLVSIYAHMSKITAEPGDEVAQGEKIGEVGATGRAYGSHVHFEIRKDGIAVNPFDYTE